MSQQANHPLGMVLAHGCALGVCVVLGAGSAVRADPPPCPETKITGFDTGPFDSFGTVALSGDWLLVGAPDRDEVVMPSCAARRSGRFSRAFICSSSSLTVNGW